MKTLWLVVIIISLVGVFVVAGMTIKVPYTGMVTYTDTVPINKVEKYKDTEPYTATECKEVNMLYDAQASEKSDCIQQECDRHEQYCVDTNFWGNCVQYAERCVQYKCVKYRKTCTLTVENKERESYTFKLNLAKYNYDTKEKGIVKTDSLYVRGLSKNSISWDFTYLSTDSMGCSYQFTETPTMTQCRDVIKQKEVTKERTVVGEEQVEKQKEVLKYHTLFEKWGLI